MQTHITRGQWWRLGTGVFGGSCLVSSHAHISEMTRWPCTPTRTIIPSYLSMITVEVIIAPTWSKEEAMAKDVAMTANSKRGLMPASRS